VENGEIAKRLQETRVNYSSSQWEKECEGLQDKIKSYRDIKGVLCGSLGVNYKIFTLGNIVPNVTDLLSDEERVDLEGLAKQHLTDKRMCVVAPNCSCADDDDMRTVSGCAEYALSVLNSERY